MATANQGVHANADDARRDRDWWVEWRKADYSWPGLAEKPWRGWVVLASGEIVEAAQATERGEAGWPATLQDYWREEQHQLVDGEGTKWTRAHVPMHWADGTPAKAAWSEQEWRALDALLAAKIAAGAQTEFQGAKLYDRNLVGADRRAQLLGAVFRLGPTLSLTGAGEKHVTCRRAYMFEPDARGVQFGSDVSFLGSCFNSDASFAAVVFGANASFESAYFRKDADFQACLLKRQFSFHAAFVVGRALFMDADVSAYADFARAEFMRAANFSGSHFRGTAHFMSARFFADAEFLGVQAKKLTAASATFIGHATFRGLRVAESTSFESARFQNIVTFADANFSGEAKFVRTVFGGDVEFVMTRFGGLAYLDQAKFAGRMSFKRAAFDKFAVFERIEWPRGAPLWHSAFQQTLFRDSISFTGSGFRALAAFDGATLERGLELDDASEDDAKRVFEHELRSAIAESKGERELREKRLKELERGCRTLKRAMESASNKTREQLLYRFELQARRAQRDTPFWEKVFSHLYGVASDYGASMTRPFIALAVLLAAFAAIFYGLGIGLLDERWPRSAWEALDFSMANTFRPLSALSEEAVPDGSLSDLLVNNDERSWATGVKALAILQSLSAVVLAFLFALAVRRRFQIS